MRQTLRPLQHYSTSHYAKHWSLPWLKIEVIIIRNIKTFTSIVVVFSIMVEWNVANVICSPECRAFQDCRVWRTAPFMVVVVAVAGATWYVCGNHSVMSVYKPIQSWLYILWCFLITATAMFPCVLQRNDNWCFFAPPLNSASSYY